MITPKELQSYDRLIGRKAGYLDVNFEVDGTHHRAVGAQREIVIVTTGPEDTEQDAP